MVRRLVALFLAGLGVACTANSPPATARAEERIAEDGRLLETPPFLAPGKRLRDGGGRTAELILERRFEGRRDLFALIDDENLAYAGVVRIRGLSDHQLDHSGPLFDADLVKGRIPEEFTAVGPVSGPLNGARMQAFDGVADRVYEAPLPAVTRVFEWQPMLRLDLDGDGAAEFEHLIRCARGSHPGCWENACEEVCTVVRSTTSTELDEDAVDCGTLLRDISDECPQQPEDRDGVQDCDGCPE